jgi:CBS-domain-containing membrane protein
MTLLYGLSAAPASQPRNIVLGQGLSMAIGICIGYADNLENWFRQSLSTSLSIAAMVELGVTHPPAGSVALLFATGQYGWGNLLFIMVGNVIAILAATFINNLSDSRQFPSFWIGMPMPQIFKGKGKEVEPEQDRDDSKSSHC